ncbi:DNA-binding MarR family transcriptional regulator [Mumia flava]|uniref:DNA-binding MarR family transcriptional regulator n=1 Tax=Mumia flava TaxID=1348852 RepID=A0A2M9BFL1_9ACTN|nr:DNA-binding MarR family transcriptional regulator [Mumia flava]
MLEALFVRIAGRAEHSGVDAFAERQLTPSQARTLIALSGRDACSIGTIAEALRMSVAAAGRNVDQLVSACLVTREECERDRRTRLVTLTDDGRDLVAEHLHAKRAALEEFARELSDEDRSVLFRALQAALAATDPTTGEDH